MDLPFLRLLAEKLDWPLLGLAKQCNSASSSCLCGIRTMHSCCPCCGLTIVCCEAKRVSIPPKKLDLCTSDHTVCHNHRPPEQCQRCMFLFGVFAVATSPDYMHYLLLFQSTANHNGFLTGLTMVLAPAVGASIFIMLAILVLHRANHRTHSNCPVTCHRAQVSLHHSGGDAAYSSSL
jgi:hypothetical protein